MAFGGQILDKPISGERFVFHTTADDSGGALLAFDLVLEPDGHVPGGHVHPVQQESFQVLTGTMRFRKGLRTVIAGPGEEVAVPPGAFHRFANAGSEQRTRLGATGARTSRWNSCTSSGVARPGWTRAGRPRRCSPSGTRAVRSTPRSTGSAEGCSGSSTAGGERPDGARLERPVHVYGRVAVILLGAVHGDRSVLN